MTSKNRPTRDQSMMHIAHEISERSTCARRAVGCVLTDSYGRVLSIGHNGVPRGMPHCIDKLCAGATEPPGYHLDSCLAMHAEMNALLFCEDIMKVHTCYTTSSPCIQCIKALLQSSCQHIVFDRVYDWKTMAIWIDQGREVTQLRRLENEEQVRPTRSGKIGRDATFNELGEVDEGLREALRRKPATDT